MFCCWKVKQNDIPQNEARDIDLKDAKTVESTNVNLSGNSILENQQKNQLTPGTNEIKPVITPIVQESKNNLHSIQEKGKILSLDISINSISEDGHAGSTYAFSVEEFTEPQGTPPPVPIKIVLKNPSRSFKSVVIDSSLEKIDRDSSAPFESSAAPSDSNQILTKEESIKDIKVIALTLSRSISQSSNHSVRNLD